MKGDVVTPQDFPHNTDRKLVLNRIECKNCGDVIISQHRHDYVTCKCGQVSTDGGRDYQRISVSPEGHVIDRSVYSDAPFEVLRHAVHRGGRGKDGKQQLTWIPLSQINDAWLKALIPYNIEKGHTFSFDTMMYAQEIKYREDNGITIPEDPEDDQKTEPDLLDDPRSVIVPVKLKNENGEVETVEID